MYGDCVSVRLSVRPSVRPSRCGTLQSMMWLWAPHNHIILFGMEFSHSKNAFLLNLLEVLRKDEKRIKEAGKSSLKKLYIK